MADKERRRNKRYEVQGVKGLLTLSLDVKILNMSLDGAAVETTKMLIVNKDYSIKFFQNDQSLDLRGRVMWSTLNRTFKSPAGDIIPVFTSGLQFLNVLDDKARSIINFIKSNRIVTLERRILGRFNMVSENALINYPQDFIVKKLSISGMLIETDSRLEPEAMVDMTVAIRDKKEITLTGRVANITVLEDESKICRIGIEFLKLNPEDRSSLKEYLDSLNHI